MSTEFINAITTQSNFTTTDNGAITHSSSLSKCADFFSVGGSIRENDEASIINLFQMAFAENRNIAVKLAFMFRDIRGGAGQRRPFRIQMKLLANNFPKQTSKLLPLFAEYGRWDDLYCVFGTPLQTDALSIIKKQIDEDLKCMAAGEQISLLGKWLKRVNTTSQESVKLGRKTQRYLKLTEQQYRKLCSSLNEYLNVTENKMSQNEWGDIDYPHVPSQCLFKNREAFVRHDGERYYNFINKVASGEETINAGTLYPYQIIGKLLSYPPISPEEAEVLWNNLPQIDVDSNSLVVADVSGSMAGIPLQVCISLALYFSEHAKGAFHNKFITFSESPVLQHIDGITLHDRVWSINDAEWEMNTNLEKVFELVLSSAITHKLLPEQMVETLYIISDMEFDHCVNVKSTQLETFYQTMSNKFIEAGYNIPKLIFWNVNGEKTNNFPVTAHTENTCMISGFSPNILKYLNSGVIPTTYDIMMEVVNSPRYANIVFE